MGQSKNEVGGAYDKMAEVYTNHVALEMTVPSIARSALEFFAYQVHQQIPGQVADVGCGPGHVTAFLVGLGLDTFGIDNSRALIDIARRSHPDIRFETGELASLPIDTGSLQGVVSKHSVIHTPAELVPPVLDEFGRVLAPGGLLLLSFFGSDRPSAHGEPFDHAVATAYQLDIDVVAGLVAASGLTEEVRMLRQPSKDERQLPHGFLFARRSQ